jgi:uncharacterized protein with NRDE domain
MRVESNIGFEGFNLVFGDVVVLNYELMVMNFCS